MSDPNTFILQAFLSGCLCHYILTLFGRGMILRPYFTFIHYWLYIEPARRIHRMAVPNNGDFWDRASCALRSALYKPMGGCPTCFNTWVSLATYLALPPAGLPGGVGELACLLLYVAAGHLSLKIIVKFVN